jgi:hypothetical protein
MSWRRNLMILSGMTLVCEGMRLHFGFDQAGALFSA